MAKRKAKPEKRRDEQPAEAKPPCQLYLITPPRIDDLPAFAQSLEAALSAAPDDAPISCLQIRLKDSSDADIIQVSDSLVAICHQYGTMVLINDRPDLVEACGADGVHIGQDDMDYLSSRTLLGRDAIIGVTCHNSRDLACAAADVGADYVAFGAFYDTETKQANFRAEPELLAWWQEMIETPCVAIGGITPDNAAPIIAAGADFLAVSSGVWNHKDGPASAVKAFYDLF